MLSIETESDLETMQAGERFAKGLKNGDTVALNGDLGVGKTVFVKGIAKGLGIVDIIVSPTYTIVREYMGDKPLYHFDVYRIRNAEEMFDVGFEEYIIGNGITVIEWACKINELLPKRRINVQIIKISDIKRKIIINDIEKE